MSKENTIDRAEKYKQDKANAITALLDAIRKSGYTVTPKGRDAFSFAEPVTNTLIHVHKWDGQPAVFSDCQLNKFEVYTAGAISPTGYSNQFCPDLLQSLQAVVGMIITMAVVNAGKDVQLKKFESRIRGRHAG